MPDIKIIIPSGFDEFDYAKRGHQVSVSPITCSNRPTLRKWLKTLRTVKGIIEKENAQKEKIRRLREENAGSLADAREKFFRGSKFFGILRRRKTL